MQAWTIRALVAIAGFAAWAMFSIPSLTGRAGIHEAWDFPAYWNKAVPILLLLVAAAGYVGRDVPWKLALSALGGHFLGVVLLKPPATDFGLLPLSLLLIGVPGLGALTLAVWLGRQLRELLRPDV
jgi:hypothetical protein